MTIQTTKLMANLKKLNGTAIASIDSKTPVKLKGGKKNLMQGRIEKVSKNSNIMLFCNMNNNSYDTMVKKRLKKEGKNPESFKISPRPWGKRVPQTPLVIHGEKTYVEAIFLSAPKNVEYLLDGKAIDKNLIEGLPVEKDNGAQSGLSDKVIIRTFNLDNITAFRCGELSVK